MLNATAETTKPASRSAFRLAKKRIIRNYDLYLLIIPVLLYFAIFHYGPMYGASIAFQDFSPMKGIAGSPFVGFDQFSRFFNSYFFWRLIRNTLILSLYTLAVTFPIPILLALMINEIRNRFFKKLSQNVSYLPHFLSTAVTVGIILAFLSPRNGVVNKLLDAAFGHSIYFMIEPAWFKTIYVWSELWQHVGWNSIIYIAALSTIDPSLYEAATIDGATRLQRIRHITIPALVPTAVIMFILNVGRVMDISFEKVFLMQNDLNREASDVFATFVYRVGLLGAEYSFSAAVGLFNAVINLALLIVVNRYARQWSAISLW